MEQSWLCKCIPVYNLSIHFGIHFSIKLIQLLKKISEFFLFHGRNLLLILVTFGHC
jgi:hypothetical protein